MEYEYVKEGQCQYVVQLRDEKLIILWRNWLFKKVDTQINIRDDKGVGPRWQYETSEISSSHRHTKYTAVCWTIPSEKNPETMWVTLTNWMNEKIKTG